MLRPQEKPTETMMQQHEMRQFRTDANTGRKFPQTSNSLLGLTDKCSCETCLCVGPCDRSRGCSPEAQTTGNTPERHAMVNVAMHSGASHNLSPLFTV